MEQKQEIEVPKEVRDLEKTLRDLHSYREVTRGGSFQGSHAETVDKLVKFLMELYQQVYKQYNEHPFVADLINKQKEAQEEAMKKAQAQVELEDNSEAIEVESKKAE